MATSLAGLSASVTRILSLTGFPKELKTKDIHIAFSEYENQNGGFKIKWKDDTSLLIVFQDPTIGRSSSLFAAKQLFNNSSLSAKRAYLHTLAFPPPSLGSTSGWPAIIRPYDGPDAQSIIQAVNTRTQHNPNNPSRSHSHRSVSISGFPVARSISGSLTNFRNILPHNSGHIAIPDQMGAREPSPTLPNIPSHPTLNALINSSLGDVVSTGNDHPQDPAILASSLHPEGNAPRIGDPGKRMIGAALGVRHPGLGQRILNGNNASQQGAMDTVQRAMGGLVVAE